MKRLSRVQQFKYTRLVELIALCSKPTRLCKLGTDENRSTVNYAFKWLVKCGAVQKTPVIIDGKESDRTFEYQRVKDMTVDDYIGYMSATRKVVEKKPAVIQVKEPKIKIEGHVMTVKECHPGRIDRKVKYGISGSSMSAFV